MRNRGQPELIPSPLIVMYHPKVFGAASGCKYDINPHFRVGACLKWGEEGYAVLRHQNAATLVTTCAPQLVVGQPFYECCHERPLWGEMTCQ